MDWPSELLADLHAAERDQDRSFAVWRPNWPIVAAFLAVATQWRQLPLVDGRVLWQGLDYAAVDRGLALAGMTLSPDQWAGVQVVEREAARVLNAR
jgi:hypothetical protein